MSKIVGTMAAFAVVATLALPGSATAAERRGDGVKLNQPAAATDLSSVHRYRYFRHRHVFYRPYWRHRVVYHRPYWRYGFYRPFYRPWYAGSPYYGPYAAYPYGFYRPGFSIGFGFGPRWGWGW